MQKFYDDLCDDFRKESSFGFKSSLFCIAMYLDVLRIVYNLFDDQSLFINFLNEPIVTTGFMVAMLSFLSCILVFPIVILFSALAYLIVGVPMFLEYLIKKYFTMYSRYSMMIEIILVTIILGVLLHPFYIGTAFPTIVLYDFCYFLAIVHFWNYVEDLS
ncbi:MAG: hypothetical protein HZC03_01280 [Candidatus Lloydbacteria bacterium]|nr:hypothetical protein [Candidatus Lloydbacteria bacterium]